VENNNKKSTNKTESVDMWLRGQYLRSTTLPVDGKFCSNS